MIGFDSLTGGGGFNGSSASNATAGNITVGGLTFSPGNRQDTVVTVVIVVAVAFGIAILMKKVS